MTEICIEVSYEEGQRIVNRINFSIEQEIDVDDFNATNYEELICNNTDFIKSVNQAIVASESWRFDYNHEDSEKLDLAFMKSAVEQDFVLIRVVKIGNKDLSFLSVQNESEEDDKSNEKEHFLKGSDFECSIDDDEFNDNFNEMLGNSILSLDYILNL